MTIEGGTDQFQEYHRIQRSMGDSNGLYLWSFERSGRKDKSRGPTAPHSRLHTPMNPSKYRPFRIDGKEYLMSLVPLTISEKLLSLFREVVSICALNQLVKLIVM